MLPLFTSVINCTHTCIIFHSKLPSTTNLSLLLALLLAAFPVDPFRVLPSVSPRPQLVSPMRRNPPPPPATAARAPRLWWSCWNQMKNRNCYEQWLRTTWFSNHFCYCSYSRSEFLGKFSQKRWGRCWLFFTGWSRYKDTKASSLVIARFHCRVNNHGKHVVKSFIQNSTSGLN